MIAYGPDRQTRPDEVEAHLPEETEQARTVCRTGIPHHDMVNPSQLAACAFGISDQSTYYEPLTS